LGQFAEAELLYEQALSIRSSTLGEVHPDVATSAHQLGHCLSQQGRHSEALVYYKQGLWVRQQQQQSSAGGGNSSSSGGNSSSGKNPEDVVASHRGVALCLAQLGCDAQAEEHLSHVLEARTADVLVLDPPPPPGQDVPVTAAAGTAGRHSRQASFAATGVFGAAAAADDGVDWSILEDGDSRLTKQQQDALLAMAAAAEELGRCYSRQGKHGEAEELYWQALEARSQVLGARHELVQATEEQLRECLDRQC
jgi:tetratricopeptide (TPR) repeat protein